MKRGRAFGWARGADWPPMRPCPVCGCVRVHREVRPTELGHRFREAGPGSKWEAEVWCGNRVRGSGNPDHEVVALGYGAEVADAARVASEVWNGFRARMSKGSPKGASK